MFWHNLKLILISTLIGSVSVFIFRKKINQKVLFIAIFLLLLVFPHIQTKTNIIRYRPLEENRKKLTIPPGNFITEIYNNQKIYTLAYEKYFNDNYGLRDLFIRLKNQIDYSLFGVSDEVLLGKDNWLFYKSVVEREEILLEQQSDVDFQNIQDKILALNKYFQDRGILLVMMPVPMKNSVYPEYYINPTTRRPTVTKFDKFMTYLKSHPKINTIDVPEILSKNKNQYQLFYKTDFHWNDTAAYLISQETIKSINKWTNNSTPWMYQLNTRVDTNFVGGQTNYLATLTSPKEDAVHVANSPKGSVPDPATPKPFLYYFKSPVTNQKLLPKTLFIGNSYFLNFLNTGIIDHFSETLMIHSNDMAKIPSAVPKDVKIVIWQLIEVDLLKGFLFK
ncbi:hypothetical protein HYV64_02910 [Candidatus Shapirobacteria bacterium]|nr:hypothetical protein [Candidatus Shapirobacteria bacterium]